MLFRKIEATISRFFERYSEKILLVTGARQVGKSYIIRYCAKKYFTNLVEINLVEDSDGPRLFEKIRTVEDFYIALGAYTSSSLGDASDTLIFLDEIQVYPHLLTMLKFLRQEGRFRYVASGSLLGVTLKQTTSVPIGTIEILKMYPLDFEEFMIASGIGREPIDLMRRCFQNQESLPDALHTRIIDIFKRYLLIGGMPEAVNRYLETRDLTQVRVVQRDIINLYKIDAGKYDMTHRLKVDRLYSMIPSNMESKKKRVVFKEIEGKDGKRARDYEDEVEYLVSSGTTLEVKAISNPKFPLIETGHKNLIKLYYNDPGLLTEVLYHNNPVPILNDERGINLGSVYECAVACQLAANDNNLFYYDNRHHGEVDYLIDDYQDLSIIPIEVKSGKDYKRHIAISRFVGNDEYGVKRAYVLSNARQVEVNGKITYMPVYFSIFFDNRLDPSSPIYI